MRTLKSLQTELWDYYKDVHGVRPRHWTEEQWNDIDFLIEQEYMLGNHVTMMTPEQREAEGWSTAPGLGFDPFDPIFSGVLCEQQRAPMNAETLAIDTQMRKHYTESYGDL